MFEVTGVSFITRIALTGALVMPLMKRFQA